MPAGRPRKPKHIKEQQGTLEKSREIDNPLDYTPFSRVPKCPESVPDDGRKYFTHCCRLMVGVGTLNAATLMDVEKAATWYALWIVSKRAVFGGESYYHTTENGYQTTKPHLTAMKDSYKNVIDFETRNGLNLTGSQKIEMKKPDSQEGDFK